MFSHVLDNSVHVIRSDVWDCKGCCEWTIPSSKVISHGVRGYVK
jgi:hypothetical protein